MRRISRAAVPLFGALLTAWVLTAHVSPRLTPLRSEVPSAHGFSRGLLNLVVLDARQPFVPVPTAVVVVVLAGTLLLIALKPSAGRVAQMLAAAGGVLFLLVAASPIVTPYRIVLAPRTFALGFLFFWSPRLGPLVWARPLATLLRRPSVAGVVCGAVAAAFFASALVQTVASYGGRYAGFLHLSKAVASEARGAGFMPPEDRQMVLYDQGYDGQFLYLMAFDPFLQRDATEPQMYRRFIDQPPYRYGRIGYPLLTRALSFGNPDRYAATMLWLIVAAHFLLGGALAAVAMRHGYPAWVALTSAAIPAFMSSLLSALPEALAAAGLIAGFALWERDRCGWAAVLFAGSLLVRETGIVFVAAVMLAGARNWNGRRVLAVAATVIPVAAWRAFVGWRLFSDWGWRGFVASPDDVGLPFGGLLRLVRACLSHTQPAAETVAGLVFPVLLLAALALAFLAWWQRRDGISTAAVIYALVAVSLRYDKIWSHLPSGERGTFELFLCLLLVLLTSRERSSLTVALGTLFVTLVGYTFLLAPDAAVSRTALLLIR